MTPNVTAYDYPEIIFTQVFDGELGVKGLHPLKMTASERDSFADRAKEKYGGNPIADTLIDIGLNPWVWLMVGTSGLFPTPAPGKLFSMAPKLTAMYRKYGPMLQSLNLLGPNQSMRGTSGEAMVRQVARSIQSSEDEAKILLGAPIGKFFKQAGIKIDSDEGRRIQKLLYAKLAGLDQEIVERSVSIKGKGNLVLGTPKTRQAILEQRLLDAELKRLGAEPLVAQVRRYLDKQYADLFLDKQGQLDAGKITRLWRSVKGDIVSPTPRSQQGYGLVQGILGKDILGEVKAGNLSLAQFEDIVKTAHQAKVGGQMYMPRNTYNFYVGNTKVGPEQLGSMMRSGRIRQGSVGIPRFVGGRAYDPDDLLALSPFVSARTDGAYRAALRTSRKVMKRAADTGEAARVLRMDFVESLSRYSTDTARAKAFYIDDLGQDVIEAQKADIATLKQRFADRPEELPAFLAKGHYNTVGGKHSFLDPFTTKGVDAPVGGWTAADHLQWYHYSVSDPYVKRALTEVVIPRLNGKASPRDGLVRSVILHGQSALKAFVDSPAGAAISNAGTHGKKLYDRMQQAALAEVGTGAATSAQGELARYLYLTHLGFNPGSVVMQLSQPLITSVRLFGPIEGLKLYGQAVADTVQDFANYSKVRLKTHGAKVGLTVSERQDILNQTIPMASRRWGNVVDIGEEGLHLADAISFQGGKLVEEVGQVHKFEDLALKLFEKAEWSNRLITGHMIRRYHMAKGMPSGFQGMLNEIKQAVQETQFGADRMNMPMVFQQEGSILANPLMRQFLQFPVRMAVNAMYTLPVAGGQSWARGLARDFTRGMGWSAITYEAMKNTVGASPDQSLYLSAVTDIFTRDPKYYIPPVLSIPKNLGMGLMEGDAQVLRQELPRLVPGGVALSRALSNLAPDMREWAPFPVHQFQKTYVDWRTRDPEGRVGVYKADGTLINYEFPSMLVAKAAGLELARGGDLRETEGFLLRQREQFGEYRRNYLRALFANDVERSERIRAEFNRRFGMDLKVKKSDVKRFMDSRTVTRPERILNSVPPELRKQVTPLVSQVYGGRLGLTPEQFNAYDTIRQRQVARSIQQDIPPEVRRLVQQAITEERKAALQIQASQQGFAGFGGF